MKQFYHGENKTSGASSDRANKTLSQDEIAGVPLTGWKAESAGSPEQQRSISYREAKNGNVIPPSIASNSDNKTGSSRSCWSYSPPDLNAQKNKQTHMHDNHIAETKKAHTPISTPLRICLVKRLNGKVEQIHMKDIHTAFPNYIPYERNDNSAFLSSVFSSSEDKDKTQGKVGDISNLPVVYQNVELNLDLVKKCRQASTSRKAFSDAKRCAKIKLPIGTTPSPSQTGNFSCNNTIYNPSGCHPSNGLRSTSQKRTFSNVQTWNSATRQGSNFFSCGQSPIRRFQSAQHPQNETTLSLCSPQVVASKRDATPQTSLLKPYAMPMLLKHSTNMILSQLKKTKGNERTHAKGTSTTIKNKDKQKEVQFGPSAFSKKQIDNQPIVDGQIDKVEYPRSNGSFKDYHQVVASSHSCSNSPVGCKKEDLTLQRMLAKTTKVKSIEKEKYIEKVNSYKVIYQSDDFVSIYQNRGDKIINDHCIDVSTLLCIPGYAGGYLCESNSTINQSHANGKENSQEEDTKGSGSVASARSFTAHPKQEEDKLWIDPNVDLLNEDLILYHLRKAINSSLTLNVDLQYLALLNKRLKNRDSVGNSLWGPRGNLSPQYKLN
ncbi:hypothetical protein AK88_04497 [Plasmodium fragile]|uniref:Uncharacterized protein n=1 Tax=Plasmodium fragile TaxID=5857 RepID=A0A0D9QFR6_PLAFR|nr:uncharacterized protein AK88_04497 [Plasmodium fragile]KJP85849.1 hypothetical protein AK88_04497 [Plasmodium fragile]